MKWIGWLMIVLGVAAIAFGGITLFRDLEEGHAHDEKIAAFDEERAATLEDLQKYRLEYRGYQKSLSEIPDSVRVEKSALLAQQYQTLKQKIRKLDMHSEDLKRRMFWEERKKDEALADTPAVAGSLGGGGLVLIVAGLLIARRSRKRVSG